MASGAKTVLMASGRLTRIGRHLPKCIFCGARANSREDVWPRWILQRFRPPVSGVFGHVGGDAYGDPGRSTVRLRCVCGDCNTGWMSRLEEECIPVLSSMAQDVAMPLDMEQRALVAAWAVKTAMVWEFFAPVDTAPYYLGSERAAMRVDRTIPDNTDVWLARYGGEPMLFSRCAEATDDVTCPGGDPGLRGWKTEIVFGRLAIQVLSLRSAVIEARLEAPPLPGPWDHCCVAIWRPQGRTCDWPPKLSLDQDVPFPTFASRWPRARESSGGTR